VLLQKFPPVCIQFSELIESPDLGNLRSRMGTLHICSHFLFKAKGAELNVEPGATPKAFGAESAIHHFTNVSRAFSACTVAIKFLGRCPRLTVTGADGAEESLLTARAREKATECPSRLLRKRRAR